MSKPFEKESSRPVTGPDWDSTTNVAHYSQLAQELLELAAAAKSAEARAEMIVLAAQYEQLARHAIANKNERDRNGSPGPAEVTGIRGPLG